MDIQKDKTGLVLSGGNAYGAFQIGALKYLIEEKGYTNWNVIAGVSVGALNGTLVAFDRFKELEQIWSEITNEKVYKGKADIEGLRGNLRVIWKELRKKSLLDNSPLETTLNKIVDAKELKKFLDSNRRMLKIGIVSLVDGKYYALQPDQFADNSKDFLKAVLASTAIPMYWPPVNEIRLEDGTVIKQAVDGGVRNKSPLGDVMKESPDEVIVINCDSYEVPRRDHDYGGIFRIALRAAMEIQHNETFRTDIKEFLRLNEIAGKNQVKAFVRGENKMLKFVSIKLIQPNVSDTEAMGSPFSFSQSDVRNRMDIGFKRAKECLRDPEAVIKQFLQDTTTRGQ